VKETTRHDLDGFVSASTERIKQQIRSKRKMGAGGGAPGCLPVGANQGNPGV
jgi:hypothetical protein